MEPQLTQRMKITSEEAVAFMEDQQCMGCWELVEVQIDNDHTLVGVVHMHGPGYFRYHLPDRIADSKNKD